MRPAQQDGQPIEMNFEMKNDRMKDSLFVLDQGWNVLIEQCSRVGASILLHNFHMGTSLLISSILRQGKSTIATSEKIWGQMKDAFLENPIIRQKIEVVLFDAEEEFLFEVN